jgi:cation transport regulator
MPYKTLTELPESVRDNLPEHAQEIYKEAFNSAWEEYANLAARRDGASQEEVAHRVAWAAVKQKYEKDEHGRWVAKREERQAS